LRRNRLDARAFQFGQRGAEDSLSRSKVLNEFAGPGRSQAWSKR
jgi:hypothetical protein